MKYANGIVTADKRKGFLSILPGDSSYVKLVWGSNSEKESPIKLPVGNTTVEYVSQCKTGRVLLFEVRGGPEKKLYFFWLQDKSTEKDNDYLERLKHVLAAKETATNPKPVVGLEDFKKLLADLSKTNKEVSLVDVLSSSIVTQELRKNTSFYMEKLEKFLPVGASEPTDLVEQVKNPQVSRAARILDAALRDPVNYKHLCSSFGVPETDPKGGVFEFLNGICKATKKE